MTLPQTVIKGAIKVQGVPDTACFDTFAQLLNSLGQFLTVEIAQSSLSNVIISNQQPGALDKDKVWFRLANSGSFLGIYIFNGTIWAQVLPAPGQVFWLAGNSTNPPPGYTLLPDDTAVFSNVQYALLFPDLTKCYPAVFSGT